MSIWGQHCLLSPYLSSAWLHVQLLSQIIVEIKKNKKQVSVSLFFVDLWQVLVIYEKHNPEKVASIDEVLDKYEGRWVTMLQASVYVCLWPRAGADEVHGLPSNT